jgi:uncharacterized protein GlcG (DUF336 family)
MALTLAEARTIIDAGRERARAMGQPVAIAVVDAAGHLISCDRMDGVALHRDRFALGKALAAVVLRQPTEQSAKLRETAPERFFGILGMFPGQIYIQPGGVPLKMGDEVVGAVGVAGGVYPADDEIAGAGIAAWEQRG